jgi:antitoxin component YwqK of YwqJK toxin-antitoxin module
VRICLTNSLGKENGIYKSYWDNGQLLEEINYIDGKKV